MSTLETEIAALAAKITETPGEDEQMWHAEADDVLVECIRVLARQIDNTEPIMARAVPATEELIANWTDLPKWYA